jgi:hypothetical protein
MRPERPGSGSDVQVGEFGVLAAPDGGRGTAEDCSHHLGMLFREEHVMHVT